ncbi:MAG: helix-turn-helix transcriptional regulator [Rhodocyclaceae bacterium]|nr:helix-turn-helix transcriptional regulator [Rhodocyclaceae bacterium]
MDAAQAFGKVLRRLRLEAGYTQEDLGFEADLRRTFISLLELGQQQPTLTTIFKLAPPLRRSAREIVGIVEEELAKDRRKTRPRSHDK